MITYIATNMETGEVIEGNIKDVSGRLEIAQHTAYNAASQRTLIHKVWLITKHGMKNDLKNNFSQDLLKEWDNVTALFKSNGQAMSEDKPRRNRLTKRNFNFTKDFIKRSIDSWSLAQCLKRLQEYENAEEDGMLIKLPCKAGTPLFEVLYVKNANRCLIVEHKMSLKFYLENMQNFGTTIFQAREEAEWALEELEIENTDDLELDQVGV